MARRLDTERQEQLEPKRLAHAKAEIQRLGLKIISEDLTQVTFEFKGHPVKFYAYSGWATGKTITDGRGWNHLYQQIKTQ